VVLRINADDAPDGRRLDAAVEAFAHWALSAPYAGDASPTVFILTERTCAEASRKLVFDTFESASRFISFWSSLGRTDPSV
jgi:hypothetical protein